MKPLTNALLLLLQIAAIASSSLSSLSAAGESPPSGITCADSSSSLQLNECLTPGKAICSSNGSWAFGIDEADQRIKLWQGDQVRFSIAFICLFLFWKACNGTTQASISSRCLLRFLCRLDEELGCVIMHEETNQMKDHRWHISVAHHHYSLGRLSVVPFF